MEGLILNWALNLRYRRPSAVRVKFQAIRIQQKDDEGPIALWWNEASKDLGLVVQPKAGLPFRSAFGDVLLGRMSRHLLGVLQPGRSDNPKSFRSGDPSNIWYLYLST